MQAWQITESKIALQNRWITVRQDRCRLPDGRMVDEYNVVVENHVACVVALTTDQRILLVEQYKHGIGEVTLEIPGGLFDSPNADPLAEARRELREETGYDAPIFHLLGALSISPARLSHRMYLVVAANATPVAEQDLDDNEEIRVHAFTTAELEAMMRDGRIHAATTVSGLYLGLDWLRREGHIQI
jgi:8-oxo-dGTP pyrophosphatase MutT (NUDIX family)